MGEVKITIQGTSEDKKKVLSILLSTASKDQLREALKALPIRKVCEVAQTCHGIMYTVCNTIN